MIGCSNVIKRILSKGFFVNISSLAFLLLLSKIFVLLCFGGKLENCKIILAHCKTNKQNKNT